MGSEMCIRDRSYRARGVPNERYPAPVHHKLAQPKCRFIELSPLPPPGFQLRVDNSSQSKRKRECHDSGRTILLAYRLEDSVPLRDLDTVSLVDWLKSIPAPVEELNISIPPAPRTCFSDNPAIIPLGPVESCDASNKPLALGMKTIEDSISASQGDSSTPPGRDDSPGSLVRDLREHFKTLLEEAESGPPKEDKSEPDSRDLEDDTMHLISKINKLAQMLVQISELLGVPPGEQEPREPQLDATSVHCSEVDTEEMPRTLPFYREIAANEARELRWDKYLWFCVSIRREIYILYPLTVFSVAVQVRIVI